MWYIKSRRHVRRRNPLGCVRGIEKTTKTFILIAMEPPNELINYLKNSIFYNTEQIQPKGEVSCGHLCLYVLKQLSLGKYLQEILNNLH